MYKKIIILFVCILVTTNLQAASFSKALIGEISKEDFKIIRPQVVESMTNTPISGVKILIPSENKFDITDANGNFKITANSNKPIILSAQKDGYRPFSLTLQDGKLPKNLIIQLDKQSPFSYVVSDNLLHLGDNSYSENSAGACLINAPCMGPEFTKKFKVSKLGKNTKAYITIGSIIGIDTIQAMKLRQNRLTSATSSPVEVFVNKTKIAELKINADNQKIPIPVNVLKESTENILTIRTGVNNDNHDYIDYDDIELMNLIVDVVD